MQKLELTWIGKDEAQQPLEPRILIENPQYSYGTVEETTLPNGKPWHGNMLIHGDNLLALKALEANFTGQVKCIYIDPPFNTGNAFEHYDDNLEHSIWLGLMYKRIEMLYKLLATNGVFCMHLDDDEVHYAKVITDEIFGRNNFICTVAIKSSTPSGVKTAHKNKTIVKQKDMILVYKKSDLVRINPLYIRKEEWDSHFNYFVDKEKEIVRPLVEVLRENGLLGLNQRLVDFDVKLEKNRKFYTENAHLICQTQSFRNEDIKAQSRELKDKVLFVNKRKPDETMFYNGRQLSPLSSSINKVIFNNEVIEDVSILLCDFWSDIDFQNTQNEGGNSFPEGKKPEKLLYRILSMFTNPGDIVLDSFLGSGTTAAVAHKMGRKYIGVELGEQAITHCYPRLTSIINQTDASGISKLSNWQGGGGFKFYELAPSLLKEDEFGNLVINPEYNAEQLAAAMALQEGFTYNPAVDVYWKQGNSSENDYIFTTTQFLTAEALDHIHESMSEDESLLICCTAYQQEVKNRYSNITVKKIPKMLLGRCAFDKDNYNLNIVAMPEIEDIDNSEEC